MNQAVDLSAIASSMNQAMLSTPFDILGLHSHPTGKGLLIRAWQLEAETIQVVLQPQGKVLGTMKPVGQNFFELAFSRRKNRFNYSLLVTYCDGTTVEEYDPYQFGEYALKQDNIEHQALYRHLGAIPVEHKLNGKTAIHGVLFKVYAPHARSVSVVGDFNQWDGRKTLMASADDGIWRLFVPGVSEGELYKYEIHDQSGKCLPLKADPFSRKSEQWPGLASIVQKPDTYQWSDKEWLNKRCSHHQKAMSVYEVHLGSWKKAEDGGFKNYRELADELIPYIDEMGFTHLELMPVSEHPLYESWGYLPVGLFAPTSRYGSPDDFRYFVDQCHKAGIGVILDWVPAHFPEDGHGLNRFDGTSIYEYEDKERGWHPDWQSCIYNFSSPWVQDFLISNALFWLDEFHIDGLRVDAVASMLYLDYSRNQGEWTPNIHGGNEHLEAVELLQRMNQAVTKNFPGCITIAEESTSWPGVSRPVDHQGLGFDYKWNMGWMHDSLAYMKRETIHRKYHHNELTFSMVYAYNEDFVLPLSHDEVVHEKGTLLTRMPGDEWQRFANLRAYLGFMFGHPGKKLLFMGGEFATTHEWNPAKSLDWELLEQGLFHKGVQQLVADLNGIYVSEPALHEKDYDRCGFSWLVLDDHEQSIFAFIRRDSSNNPVIVISNMTPAVRHDYRMGVPVAGKWQEMLNTDASQYGGSGVINCELQTDAQSSHSYDQSLVLTVPPLGTVIIKPCK